MPTIKQLTYQNNDLKAKINILNDKLLLEDIKHKEEVTNLKKEIKELNGHINSLIKSVKELSIKVENLTIENAKLKEENKRLKDENKRLKNDNDRMKYLLGLDSTNSSLPSSYKNINVFSKPQKIEVKNNREKTDKKIGGQLNHKGVTLTKEQIIENINNNNFKHEIINIGKPEGKYVSKYVLDIKIDVVAKEYRIYIENAKIPAELKSNVTYGEELKTICSLLNVEGIVSINRISSLIKQMTHDKIKLSQASIINFLSSLNKKCEPTLEQFENEILNDNVMYTDGTTINCNSKNYQIRNYCSENIACLKVTEKKNIKSLKEMKILSQYTGIIVHDHETALYNFGLKENHCECNVHIGRYLNGIIEDTKNSWAKLFKDFLINIKIEKEELIKKGIFSFSKEKLDYIFNRYIEILNKGLEENKEVTSKYFKDKELALIKRLKKYMINHLKFATDFNAPYDNNLSERTLRHVKIKQKISGMFKNIENIKYYLNIKSIIITFKNLNKNYYDFFKNLYKINLGTN